jgi:hypothetical protein
METLHMAKFDLKSAKKNAQDTNVTQPMVAGYSRVIITQIAEVGLQKAFNPDDDPKASIGVVFENKEGQQISKIMTLAIGTYSTFSKLIAAVEDADNDLADLIRQELVIEIVENGKWPKIANYYSIDDGLSDDSTITSHSESLYYTVDEPNPEVLKKLHPLLKQAIAARIRVKGI